MHVKRGSVNYVLVALLILSLTLLITVPYLLQRDTYQEFIPPDTAERVSQSMVTTDNHNTVFERGNAILSHRGYVVLDLDNYYQIDYDLEQCPNFQLEYTVRAGENQRTYNPLRQSYYFEDGQIRLKALTREQARQAIIDEQVYQLHVQTQNQEYTNNINQAGELYFQPSDFPVTIRFQSKCQTARIRFRLSEVLV